MLVPRRGSLDIITFLIRSVEEISAAAAPRGRRIKAINMGVEAWIELVWTWKERAPEADLSMPITLMGLPVELTLESAPSIDGIGYVMENVGTNRGPGDRSPAPG